LPAPRPAALPPTAGPNGTGVTTFSYNPANALEVVTYPGAKTITYTFDEIGNRQTMTDPDAGLTSYSFDSRNLISWLVNPFAERTTWVYDAIGRVTTMTHGNASVAEHDYDTGGRLTAVRNLKSDRSVISVFTYSYDSIGNRTGVQEANGDLVTWSYDETYQLTREQRSGDNAYDTTFSYDGVGNRLTQVSSGATTTYAYDAANELTTSEDASGVTTFTYDSNGNTTGEIRPNADRVTYTWDIENHLTKIELPASVVNTVTLDGDGKRRTIEDSDGLRKLMWDLENILAETDSNNATVAVYTLAPEEYGELISQRRSGATAFHHFDGLGSTNKLTGADQASLIEYLYRAFGQHTVLSGSSPNRFTWVGQLGYYRQPDPDDYWVRARITSRSGQGFLSSVSLRWPDEHPYNYCDNDPVNWVDSNAFRKRKKGDPYSKPPTPTARPVGGTIAHCWGLLRAARAGLDQGGCRKANDRIYDLKQQCLPYYPSLSWSLEFYDLIIDYFKDCPPPSGPGIGPVPYTGPAIRAPEVPRVPVPGGCLNPHKWEDCGRCGGATTQEQCGDCCSGFYRADQFRCEEIAKCEHLPHYEEAHLAD